jgi:hypothetical protein
MGERMTGSHEVRGSIPLSSTNDLNNLHLARARFFISGYRLGLADAKRLIYSEG